MVDFEVLIIGTNMIGYYMARCFHEAYNVKSFVLGQEKLGFTNDSKILELLIEPKLDDEDVFLKTLITFYEKHKDNKIILVGSSDDYVKLIVKNEKVLRKYFLFNYAQMDIIDSLMEKENFYTTYKNSGLEFPKTYIYSFNTEFKLPSDFMYPIILKPSNVVTYNQNKFARIDKIYKLQSESELESAMKAIKDSGYKDSLIFQEFIPGDDSRLFDSAFYVNSKGQAVCATLAQIGLQEHTKTAIGNCTVLINGFSEFGYNNDIVLKLKEFIESIGFRGFCEFDLKYDERDGKFKVFEINARQGRCGYYMTPLGYNLAKCLVDDLIYNKDSDFKILDEEYVLTMVPKTVMKRHISNKIYKKKLFSLIRSGKWVDPLIYNKDRSIKRRWYLFLRKINYIKKYRDNEW